MDKSPISSEHLLCRIRNEYQEMPGLQLTSEQAERLWGIDQPTCRQLLESLVVAGFLCRTRSGSYVRT